VSLGVQVREVCDQGQQAGVGAHHLRGPPPLHVSDPGIYNKYSLQSRTESFRDLKVLSSEMDLVEIRLIRYIFIKGNVVAAF
jgi:hypothetical protein